MGLAIPKPQPRAKRPRSGLARSAPMRRSWIKRRRPRRLDGAGSDLARLSWIHEQECLLLSFDITHRCTGRIEAAHEGRKPGLAMKCPDSETIPLCSGAHGDWTNHLGFFRGWPRERRREWAAERIAETTSRYLSAGNRRTS